MTVLLVDDNTTSLMLQKIMLESYSLTVDTATCGEEAINLARENEYSAVIIDVKMPVMDGFTLCGKIREFNKDIKLFMMCADENICNQENLSLYDIKGVLQKPLKLDDINEVLSPYLELVIGPKFNRKTDVIFDRDELLSVLSDERAMKKLLLRFISAHKDDCKNIIKFIDNLDYLNASDLLHELLCISGNLYCGCLYEALARSLAEVKSGFVNEHSVQVFVATWKKTTGKLAECTLELTYRYKPELDKTADWGTIWHDFYELCREFDVEATNIFNNNVPLFLANLPSEEFNFLQNAVNAYDYLSIIESGRREDV